MIRMCRRGRRGFTLIELLTVIGIIAILAAMIMTAVVSAQESGRTAHCKNNLAQLHKLIFLYATSYSGFLPGMWHERWVGELWLTGNKWRPGNLLHDNDPRVPQVWNNTSPNPLGRVPVRSGAPFLLCKSDLSGYRCDQGAMVSYLGLAKYGWHHLRGVGIGSYVYHQIQEYDQASRRTLLMESEPATWQYGGCGCRWHSYSYPKWILERHYGGGNILFFDGHVEIAKGEEKRRIAYWEPCGATSCSLCDPYNKTRSFGPQELGFHYSPW